MSPSLTPAFYKAVIGTLLACNLSLAIASDPAPVIVVTPTRFEIPMARSPVPLEVISREQIENSAASDVADIITMYSGLEVARNGGPGTVTSLFTRGSESNHTVILIDGVKINPATLGAPALQNISTSIIDRIEIVKGPRSSVYGSEAIGGVVNIITRKQVLGAISSVTLGAGNNQSNKVILDTAYGNGEMSLGLTLEQFGTEGFTVTDLSTEKHGYDNQTLNTFIDYRAHNHHLNLRHWQSAGNVEYYYFAEQNQDYKNSATAIQWDSTLTDRLDSSLRLSQISDDIQQNEENYLSQLDQAVTHRQELDIRLDYQLNPGSVFSAGALQAAEEVAALSYGTVIDENTDIDEYYALFHVERERHNYALSLRQTRHEDFGDHDTWNLDYQYALDQAVKLYGGLGSGFRAPDHTDRFGSLGNPGLQPETSDNLELGLIFDLSAQSRFQISVFQNRITDLIEPNASFTQMINVDEAVITGIDIAYRNRVDRWSYQVNALLQDPRNKTLNALLSRRAQSRINAMLGYHQQNWQLSTNASLVSPRDDSSYNDIILPRYELVDLSLGYRFSPHSNLTARLENVFNEQYQTASGFKTQDRYLMLEWSYRFTQ